MTRLFSRRQSSCARRGFTYVELLVVLVLIVVGIAFLIPTRRIHEGSSNRTKCASNLRQIGQAILLYSNDNRGAYPMTNYTKGAQVFPTWGSGADSADPWGATGPKPNDVTAALFLLLRTQDITSEVFTCPSSNAQKDEFGGGTNAAINRSNFTDIKKNLSYSYQNPYPNDAAINSGFKMNNTLGAEFAVAADINPGIAGEKDVLKATATSSAADMKKANSENHDGDGQNILYGDGHVAWESNPFVGIARDNIYTTADGQINASSVDANDNILLPTDD
jgi:prepilin-type N-terminal cleavage/methylation domain-containing protein/prepilin-type processing-associated H-X9-DG protein